MFSFQKGCSHALLTGLVVMLSPNPAQAALTSGQKAWISEEIQGWINLSNEGIQTKAQAFANRFVEESKRGGLEPTASDLHDALSAAEYKASSLGLWPAILPLLKAGADPNLRMAPDGDTALLSAARKAALSSKDTEAKYEEAIAALVHGVIGPDNLETRADPNLKDSHGNTALSILTRAGKGHRFSFLSLEPRARKASIQTGGFASVADKSTNEPTIHEHAPLAPAVSSLSPERQEGPDSQVLRDWLAELLKCTSTETKETLVAEFCHYARCSTQIIPILNDAHRYETAVAQLELPSRYKKKLFGQSAKEQYQHRVFFDELFYRGRNYIQVLESENYNEATINEISTKLSELKTIFQPMLDDPYFEQRISATLKTFTGSLSYFKQATSDGLGKMVVKKFVENYYKENSDYNRKCLLATFIKNERNTKPSKRLPYLLRSAGPLMHHLLQIVSDTATSEPEQAYLAALAAKPLPLEGGELDLALKQEVGTPFSELFPGFERTPYAVTSQCQFHLATHQGQAILLKLKKPFNKVRTEGEFALLQSWVERLKAPKSTESMIQQWKDSVAEELDFDRERHQLTEGYHHYHTPAPGILALEPASDVTFKDALVLNLGKFSKVEKVKASRSHPSDKKALLLNLLRKVLNTAIFEDGYLNTDLKDGSLLLASEAGQAKPHGLVLLNATHTTSLSPTAQKAIVLIFAGLETRNHELILSGFKAMANLTRFQEEELTSLVLKELADPASASGRFNALLTGARQLAVAVDDGVLAFNRGRLHLERQIEACDRQLKRHGLQDKASLDIAAVYAETFSKSIRTSKMLLGPNLGKPRESSAGH